VSSLEDRISKLENEVSGLMWGSRGVLNACYSLITLITDKLVLVSWVVE
jgi:hypothetical protein